MVTLNSLASSWYMMLGIRVKQGKELSSAQTEGDGDWGQQVWWVWDTFWIPIQQGLLMFGVGERKGRIYGFGGVGLNSWVDCGVSY